MKMEFATKGAPMSKERKGITDSTQQNKTLRDERRIHLAEETCVDR